MNDREINNNTPGDATTSPRPWIEPTFERVTLIEAQSGVAGVVDALYSLS